MALTRKNALFASHDDGAENWAMLASLIETAKLHGIDPQAWLADVLSRLVNLWLNDRIDYLMPWIWAAAHQPVQLGRRYARVSVDRLRQNADAPRQT